MCAHGVHNIDQRYQRGACGYPFCFVGLRNERDIHKVLNAVEDGGFVSPGNYRDLYNVLRECSMDDVAWGLKQKADELFGTDSGAVVP